MARFSRRGGRNVQDILGLPTPTLQGLGAEGDWRSDEAPYPETPGQIHTNKDGTDCYVWSRDACTELPPVESYCGPGYRRGVPPNESVYDCVWLGEGLEPCSPSARFVEGWGCLSDTLNSWWEPELVQQPPGTRVSWSPVTPDGQLFSGYNGEGLKVGRVMSPDERGLELYPTPPDGWNWISWQYPQPGSAMEDAWASYMASWPHDATGLCASSMQPPLPRKQWSASVGCAPASWFKGIPTTAAFRAYTDAWARAVEVTRAAGNTAAADAIASGQASFIKFKNRARWSLNQFNVMKDGQRGTVYNDNVGLYWNGSDPLIKVRNFSYFDKKPGIESWWDVYETGVKGIIDATVGDVPCSILGKAAASAAGPEALVIWTIACGGGGGHDPGGGKKDDKTAIWVAAGAGAVLLGLLGVVAFKRKG